MLSKHVWDNIGQGIYLCHVHPECTDMFLQENDLYYTMLSWSACANAAQERITYAVDNKCNRVKWHGKIYINDIIKK